MKRLHWAETAGPAAQGTAPHTDAFGVPEGSNRKPLLILVLHTDSPSLGPCQDDTFSSAMALELPPRNFLVNESRFSMD